MTKLFVFGTTFNSSGHTFNGVTNAIGHPKVKNHGVGTSTLLGASLVEQVLRVNLESHGFSSKRQPWECQTGSDDKSRGLSQKNLNPKSKIFW